MYAGKVRKLNTQENKSTGGSDAVKHEKLGIEFCVPHVAQSVRNTAYFRGNPLLNVYFLQLYDIINSHLVG